MLKKTLCQIGFTYNEAKIYIALVELGPQPVNIIANKAGLHRTTAYPILKNLQKKSLISSFIKNGIIYFTVNDLNDLLGYIDRKKRFIDHQRDFVIDILPRMERLKSDLQQSQPKVRYFEGPEGAQTAMNDSLKSNGPILCITSVDKWLNSGLRGFITDYIYTRLFEKKIPLRGLAKDTEAARCFLSERYKGAEKLSEVRFIKGGDELFDNIVNIYDNKVVIVSPDKGFEFGVLIESEEFARTQRSIFELAWRGAIVYNREVTKNNKDKSEN
jgi:sugar-specific transcriptional regulator TrmB